MEVPKFFKLLNLNLNISCIGSHVPCAFVKTTIKPKAALLTIGLYYTLTNNYLNILGKYSLFLGKTLFLNVFYVNLEFYLKYFLGVVTVVSFHFDPNFSY